MKDEVLIQNCIRKCKEAEKKVKDELANLSLIQLNWQAHPSSWSAAQCLDHLMKTDIAYFPLLESITSGTHKMSFWEKHSPLSSFFGKYLRENLSEQVKKKMKTNRKMVPGSKIEKDQFVDDFMGHLKNLDNHLTACTQVDLDEIVITSPFVGFVTYTLRDALQIIVQHEHRHINQAIRVTRSSDFPT